MIGLSTGQFMKTMNVTSIIQAYSYIERVSVLVIQEPSNISVRRQESSVLLFVAKRMKHMHGTL